MSRSTSATRGWSCLLLLIGGCSVTGEWERIATEPPQAMFPVDTLHLSDDQSYTAKWEHRGRKLGSTGTYRYQRGTLSVSESGREPRDYRTRRRLDGTLELSYTVNGKKITAILRRASKSEKPVPDSATPPAPTPAEDATP